MARSAQTHKSISFIWILWSTLYVYLWLEPTKKFGILKRDPFRTFTKFSNPLTTLPPSQWFVLHLRMCLQILIKKPAKICIISHLKIIKNHFLPQIGLRNFWFNCSHEANKKAVAHFGFNIRLLAFLHCTLLLYHQFTPPISLKITLV